MQKAEGSLPNRGKWARRRFAEIWAGTLRPDAELLQEIQPYLGTSLHELDRCWRAASGVTRRRHAFEIPTPAGHGRRTR